MRKLVLAFALVLGAGLAAPAYAHGGGLNACGCHFNRTTGECHCHQDRGCGCACQPAHCPRRATLPWEAGRASCDAEPHVVLAASKSTSVRGHTRKDGTYIAPHQRSAPNRTKSDNWSTKGKTNPHTGKKGTKKDDT